MDNKKKLVFIKELNLGGCGGEAEITVALRTIIRGDGVGGTIYTEQPIVAAFRREFNQSSGQSFRLFLKHILIKKLDDYFQKAGKYCVSHIPRPIGLISRGEGDDGYIYEWVFGSDGFPWYAVRSAERGKEPVILGEWNECTNAFITAGIDIGCDVCDLDNADISQNVVHQLSQSHKFWDSLNCLWQRIDFGDSSIMVDYEKLEDFIAKSRKDALVEKLENADRYEMMVLAIKYLHRNSSITERDLGKLEILIRAYRLSAMRHFVAQVSDNESDLKIINETTSKGGNK